MPNKKNSGNIPCIYCGQRPGITRDHVIPRVLLPEKIPQNVQLITVPACAECNSEKEHDDTYLRDLLSMDAHTEKHWATPPARNKFLSSARRNRSEIARLLPNATGPEAIYTQTGTYMGEFVVLRLDPKRQHSIFSRIVRGLYWNAYKKRVPDDYEFEILQVLSPDAEQEILKWEKRLNCSVRPARDACFGQAHVYLDEDPFQFIWLLVFYGGYIAIVQTRKKENTLPFTADVVEHRLADPK